MQYLSGYDAVALNQCIQNLHNLTDDESILLSSIWQSISHLTVEQVEDPEHTFDFRYPPYIFNLISMLSVYKKIHSVSLFTKKVSPKFFLLILNHI